jgi:hypothetical protein
LVHKPLTDPSQPNELPKPTLKDTALYRAPIWAYHVTVGRFLHKSKTAKHDETSSDEEDEPAAEAEDGSDGVEDFEVLDKVKTTAPNGVVTGKAVRRNKKSAKGR